MRKDQKLAEGRYRVDSRLKKGGMGEVWLAHDELLERLVAIKVVLPEYDWSPRLAEAFLKEAQIIAKLEHPHILRIYDLHTETEDDNNFVYMVMQYASGGSLADRLQSGPLAFNEAEHILRQVCQGVDYAHRKRVIHLDLKPANILFDDDGNALVADFGLAKLLGKTTNVKANTRVGTVDYMPPEQLFGGIAGAESDIYALGMTLHELLTGQVPKRSFTSSSYKEGTNQHK